jgi:hypothetical protein
MRIIGLLCCSLLLSLQCIGASLKGRVTDEKGQTIPFVAIYVDGTTQGTTSNIDGDYTLELKPGNYKIDFNLIGYELHTENVIIADDNVTLNVTMKFSGVQEQGIVVYSNKEDPAYAIIRNAIKKRKYYLEQVNSYSCDVYIKGLQRVIKHPKKIFGMEVDMGGADSTGIIYLSESVSKFNFKQTDKVKEEMVSSKVSGHNNAFSYNQASDMLINFYKNNIEISEISERGFISPIANNALFFYKYHLAGTFQENGHTIDKIEVIPKRRYDPVFRGYIYISEDGWRIHSTDMYLTKDAQIQFVDTIYVGQTFLPVDSATWMIFSNKFKFTFDFLGIKGEGVYMGINKNYVLNPNFPKGYFNGEIMKVDEDANKKDSSYWKDTRPVPLTKMETKDYHRRDSLESKRESKPYLDSLDRKKNTFHLTNILLGYRYYQRYEKQSWYLAPLIQTIDFNTVQGWNAGAKLTYSKEYSDNKRLFLIGSGGYGFSNKKAFEELSLSYSYNPQKFAYFVLGAGDKPLQYNHLEPITPFFNSLYSLFQDENYMKLYEKTGVYARHGSELANGIFLMESIDYADRKPLMNTSNFRVFQIGNRAYTSNNPQQPQNDSIPAFSESKALVGSLLLRIKFKQQYVSRPHQKIVMDSKYPILTLEYKKAIGGISGLDANYDFAKATLSGSLDLHLFGETEYSITAGKFFTQKDVQFMDYYHFQGNRTIFSSFDMGSFHLLDYYTYSTTGPFLEGHLEHNFEGFILNKIPLLRKLKLDEIIGVNYLTTDALKQYMEFYVGLSKLQTFRIDFATSFDGGGRVREGIVIGLGF